jgi:hypothetical protein
MLSFSAEFPVNASANLVAVGEVFKNWIVNSPYTQFSQNDVQWITLPGSHVVESGSQKVEYVCLLEGDSTSMGIRHHSRSDGADWITEIVFSRNAVDSWVGVRTSRESELPITRLPEAKKPHVIKTLLAEIGGGIDKDFKVSDSPHYFDQGDIELAEAIVNGRYEAHLPIVYISYSFAGGYSIPPDYVARQLGGLAHVVCEPNRRFSTGLRVLTNARNVYGGSVGIYWPKGSGKRALFIGEQITTPAELVQVAIHEIRVALLNRRPLSRCSWNSVQQAFSQAALEELRSVGSNDLSSYMDAFDTENAALRRQLAEAEMEVERLKFEHAEADKASRADVILLKTGVEQSLVDGEICQIIMDVIRVSLSSVQNDSRRQHVLQAIVSNNNVSDVLSDMRSRLKKILKGYQNMTTKIRRDLEELGFIISEDGKHYKLVYLGDDRYTFSLPKSGSDHRGGLNAVSDIAKRIF